MKKSIMLLGAGLLLTGYSFARAEGANSCIETYKGRLAPGYNAVAAAEDEPFRVCGYAAGQALQKHAERIALVECEKLRTDPANDSGEIRKVMTHCRIIRSDLIE